MVIDKNKTLKYANFSDSAHAICLVVCLLFFPQEFIYLLGFWLVTFFYSGLALRRYCKGNGMIRFGVSRDIDRDDTREIVSSYNNHLFTIGASNIVMIGITIYYLYQNFI